MGDQYGFTLTELLIVIAIIGILAAILLPTYAAVQTRARISKAQADARALATAMSMYQGHMGVVATAFDQLTQPLSNLQSQTGGPFMAAIPAPPTGWSTAYTLTGDTGAGTFQITASGDNTTVSMP